MITDHKPLVSTRDNPQSLRRRGPASQRRGGDELRSNPRELHLPGSAARPPSSVPSGSQVHHWLPAVRGQRRANISCEVFFFGKL